MNFRKKMTMTVLKKKNYKRKNNGEHDTRYVKIMQRDKNTQIPYDDRKL